MTDLTEHRLSQLETSVDGIQQTLKSVDGSLRELVTIQRTHTETLREVKNIGLIVERHNERLDSHRWALRAIFGAVGTLLVGIGVVAITA